MASLKSKKVKSPSVVREDKVYLANPSKLIVTWKAPKSLGNPRPLFYDILVNQHKFERVFTQHKFNDNQNNDQNENENDKQKEKKQEPQTFIAMIENLHPDRLYKISIECYNEACSDLPQNKDTQTTKEKTGKEEKKEATTTRRACSGLLSIKTLSRPSQMRNLVVNNETGVVSWDPPTYIGFGTLKYELIKEIEVDKNHQVIESTKKCQFNLLEIYKNDKNALNKLQWRVKIIDRAKNYSLSPVFGYNDAKIKTQEFPLIKKLYSGRLSRIKTRLKMPQKKVLVPKMVENNEIIHHKFVKYSNFDEMKDDGAFSNEVVVIGAKDSNYTDCDFVCVGNEAYNGAKQSLMNDANNDKDKDNKDKDKDEEKNNSKDYISVLCFSDTHTKHNQIKLENLPDADIVLHAGDFTYDGRLSEVESFEKWGKKMASMRKRGLVDNHKQKEKEKEKEKEKDKDKDDDKDKEEDVVIPLEERKFKHLVCVAGNHECTFDYDFYTKCGQSKYHKWFENDPKHGFTKEQCKDMIAKSKYWTYLEDSSVTIEGIKIFGSPWQPTFGDWAFGLPLDGEDMVSKWQKIEQSKCDILLTHCPPYCHGDRVSDDDAGRGSGNPFTGSPALLQSVMKCSGEGVQNPIKYHVFGHIHRGFGITQHKNCQTWFVNAATCDAAYRPFHTPVLFFIEKQGVEN